MGFYAVTTFISVRFWKFSNLDLDKIRENIGNEWTIYIIQLIGILMGEYFLMNKKKNKN